ncbi:MAG: PAS domain S-box protein [Desulfobacterales bacterium]|nr:PAS domain S-box protein [Desulfobacterales bacterium]
MAFLKSQDDMNLPDSIELDYQRYLVKVCMLVGIPVLGYFMIYDLIIGRYLVALVLIVMFVLLVGLFVVINKPGYKSKESQIYSYFVNSLFVLYAFFLAYTIGIEGNLSRMPWAFLFTVIVFFALGATRALIWVSVVFFSMLILELVISGNDHLSVQEFKVRFYIAFMLVIVTSFFFERLKKGYQLELIKNQQTLKESENRYREAFEQLNDEMKERRRAEAALKESEERFRELAEMMPETVFEADLEGKLTFANRNAFNYFGYTQQDLKKGLKSIDMIIQKDRERAQKNIAKILGGEKSGINEYTALRKDGGTFPVLIHSAPIFKEGKPVGLRGFIVDITARKKAEEERRKLEVQFLRAQRFEALGTLAGGIAHDFNNLLMNIQGNTSLMLFEIENDHPFFEPLKKIEKQVKSGALLTRQMLGYARKGKFNVKPVDLNQIVDESAETFGRTRKEITIQREFDEDLFPVEADQGQIEQVLLNLYVNAADAMPGGGKLFLKTKNETHVNIKSKHYSPTPGNYLQLTITDSGAGMDNQILERIFDPFFTTKEMGRGTGLGLASVYGIIKSHDGYIDVESKKGRGTTFTIFLPASEKDVEGVDGTTAKLIKGSGTLLIVDDEELVLNVGVNMLEKLGYTVLAAKNGTEAVDIFEANKDKIKMVVLDIIMPDMGGGEVYDKIKAINPDVKVLLSSGYSVDGQAIELLERGCDGFMQKPFTLEELSGKITQIMKK